MRVFCAFLAIIIFFTSTASAFDLDTGQYYFRYKGNAGYTAPNPVDEDDGYAKDITVFYVGGVGHPFSERLPLKPQWEDDSWQIVEGTLPSGLTFDPVTRLFSGTPDAPGRGVKVDMIGVDDNGRQIADATVSFDILVLPDNVQEVDLYAHTNKYISHSLPLPDDISVYRWERIYPAPQGVEINERFFDGTPTQEGIFPVLIQGYNYLGEAIIAYMGKYTVENGPSFPFIADDYANIDIKKLYREVKRVNTRIKRAVGDPNLVRYFVELNPSDPLPGTLQIGGDVSSRTIEGKIYNPYEDGSVRFRAVDIDGTEGYSNWFKIGALGPDPQCKPTPDVAENGQIRIPGVVDRRMSYTIPFEGAIGARNYVLVDPPTLPAWLSFDTRTGMFSGTPTEKTTIENLNVRIELTNLGNVDTETCGPYTIDIVPAGLSVSATIEERDIRVGSEVSVAVTTQGKLVAPYSISLDPTSNLPAGLQFDSQSLTMKGIVNQAGSYQARFILENGDGRKLTAGASFRVYPPLDIYDVVEVTEIQRYSVSEELIAVSYGTNTVIGEPITSLIGTLPAGIAYNGQSLVIAGGTKFPEGEYGPYQIRLSDDTGEEDLTAPFMIRVTPREDMLAGATASAKVILGNALNHRPFTVIQPPLAYDLPLTYDLSGPDLPPGVVFDDGRITGTPTQVGEYTGYSIRVTDSDQKSAESELFDIKIVPEPDGEDDGSGDEDSEITPLIIPQTVGNVTGEIPTFITTGTIDLSPRDGELVGGVGSVRFKSAEPMVAGLTFDYSNGQISGSPTEEFTGTITITYEDGAGREGIVEAPFLVLPYPALNPSSEYKVPRHEDLSKKNLRVSRNTGWRGAIQWSVDPTSAPLPAGVKFVDGQFIGTTAVALGDYPSIVVRAHDSLTGIFVVSAPFTLSVVPGSNMGLNLSPGTINFHLDQGQLEVRREVFVPSSLIPSGTYIEPIRYSMIGDTPPGLGIDPITGQFTTAPATFGEWPVTVRVTDSEGRSADADVTVIAVLDGAIEAVIDGLPTSGQPLKRARVGETIATPAVVFRSVQGDYTLSLNRSVPLGMNFNYRTARFYGMFSSHGEFDYAVTALDQGGRELSSPLVYPFSIAKPLSIPSAESLYEVKQYTPSGISLSLPKAQDVIGKASYMFSGSVPGTLIIREYSYVGQPYYLKVEANGDVTPILEANLPLDSIVFDTKEATLTGVATRLGLFSGLTYVAEDDHMDKYLVMSDPTRVAHNTATSKPFAIQVNLPDPIELNVADYKTKPGFVFSMAAPWTEADVSHGNTYGAVNYFLTTGDAAANPELSLDTQTGALSGSFATTGIRRVNINVSDITNRLTSKTVTIEVMPNLRLIVPQTVYLNSNGFSSEAIGVDYAIGDVTFEKGSGDWPVGVSVDPATGAIIGQPQGGTEEYRNLTIVGTDAAGDRQVSNQFRIVAKPIGPYVLLLDGFLPNGSKRSPYEFDLRSDMLESAELDVASGLDWGLSAKDGELVPPGLFISNGVIRGTPTSAGDFSFTVSVASKLDAATRHARSYALKVEYLPISIDFVKTTLDEIDFGSNVSISLAEIVETQNIPVGSLQWTMSALKPGQRLPTGLAIGQATLQGVASEAGTFEFTITATFSDGDEVLTKDADLKLIVRNNVSHKQMISLFGGDSTQCGVDKTHDLYCWGRKQDVTTSIRAVPTILNVAEGVTSGAVNASHGCVVGISGTVHCWGNGANSRLGNGTTSRDYALPVINLPLSKKVDVLSLGGCSLALDGSVWCWGSAARGMAVTAATLGPAQVPIAAQAVDVATATTTACAVLTTGRVQCWGSGSSGQLGNGTTSASIPPVYVSAILDAVSIDGGAEHFCVVRSAGTVSCWGSNSNRQTTGTGSTALTPRTTTPAYSVKNIVAAANQSCIVGDNGSVSCWGLHPSGNLTSGPTLVTQVVDTKQLSMFDRGWCALDGNGAARCWGEGLAGQLGNGSRSSTTIAVGVSGYSP